MFFLFHVVFPEISILDNEKQNTIEKWPPAYKRIHYHLIQQSKQLSDINVVFIGDSLTQSYNPAAVFPHSVNFGISGDTITGLTFRLKDYQNLNQVDSLVMMIGINDIVFKKKHPDLIKLSIKKLVRNLPQSTDVYWRAILPLGTDQKHEQASLFIDEVNNYIKQICEEIDKCFWVETPESMVDENNRLKDSLHIGDGLHLRKEAYEILSISLHDIWNIKE